MSITEIQSLNLECIKFSSIYNFSVYDFQQNIVLLKDYYFGKVCLIVNIDVANPKSKLLLHKLKNVKDNLIKSEGNISDFKT